MLDAMREEGRLHHIYMMTGVASLLVQGRSIIMHATHHQENIIISKH